MVVVCLKALSECFSCVLAQVQRSLDEWEGSEEEKFDVMREASKSLKKTRFGMKPTELSKIVNDISKSLTKTNDLYKDRKKKLNESALAIVDDMVNFAESSHEPLKTLALATILGNHLDLGVKEVEIDSEFIKLVGNSKLVIDDFRTLKDKLENAKSLLYILDNTGEIVFDKAFIYEMKRKYPIEIKVAVRSAPIINDATKEDAIEVGFKKENIINSGTTMAGMSIEFATDEFMSMWKKADVIISKGQGNFEGLDEVHDERLFFFLEAKCPVISKVLGVKVGDAVLTNLKR